MEIKQIKYFVEVVRQGGMTQASEHLYIAQSTISKAIKILKMNTILHCLTGHKTNKTNRYRSNIL